MKEYIQDTLATGILPPLSSLVEAGFFFVNKKDHTLKLCMDETVLNHSVEQVPITSHMFLFPFIGPPYFLNCQGLATLHVIVMLELVLSYIQSCTWFHIVFNRVNLERIK